MATLTRPLLFPLILLAILMLLVALVFPQIGSALPPVDVLMVTTGRDIDLVNLNSGVRHRLTDQNQYLPPVWSPDGETILIYAIPKSGTEPRLILASGATRHVLEWAVAPLLWMDWSADGSQIALHYDDGFTGFIDILDRDGTLVNTITIRQDLPLADLTWSPDRSRIAYTAFSGGERQEDIYLIDVETGETIRRSTPNFAENMPVWSPDGEHLVYMAYPEGSADLFRLDVHEPNGQPLRLTNDPQSALRYDNDPVWSPDGSLLAFTSTDPRASESTLKITNPDGSDPQLMRSPEQWSNDPVWSPDGTRIAFKSSRIGPSQPVTLYFYHVSTETITSALNGITRETHIAWKPYP